MTKEESDELDRRIEELKPEIFRAKKEYDSLIERMSMLVEQRYPERRDDAIKERLFEAYRRSGKSVEFIIDFIENADDEDDYWA